MKNEITAIIFVILCKYFINNNKLRMYLFYSIITIRLYSKSLSHIKKLFLDLITKYQIYNLFNNND